MPPLEELKPVASEQGKPLYVTVKNRMLEAIREGVFKPGDRLPSTQEISRQMKVSLVTMHRALQELESGGVVDRLQGRGTFVTDAKKTAGQRARLGLILQPEASIADFYHSQVLEGMHRGARETGCDLSIIQGADNRKPVSQGYMLLNPVREQIARLDAETDSDTPVLIVGARHDRLPWIDVDNLDLIDQAVSHVHRLGHRRVAFIGGADELSNSRDRRRGFVEACDRLKLPAKDRHDIIAQGWQLDSDETMEVNRMLGDARHPTAVIAGGYHLALDIYKIAGTLGMGIPGDLTVVGVDDPPSAAHLYPPLTTVRQPLIQLGYAAIGGMIKAVAEGQPLRKLQALRASLVIRESSGTA